MDFDTSKECNMEEHKIQKKSQCSQRKRKICEVIYANPILRHKNDEDKDIKINSTTFTIGRGKTCDHILIDLSISRNHCICSLDESTNEWFLTDKSSTGTMLNQVKLTPNIPCKLRSGDEIQLGNEDLFIYVFTSDSDHSPNKVQSLISTAVDENKPSNNYIQNKKIKIEEVETLKLEKKELQEDLRQQKKERDKLFKEKEEIEKKLATLNENIETNLTCAICNEMFIKSITLNCSHSFCQWCIDQWKKTKKQCPICRAKIKSENHLFTFDNIISAHFEAADQETKNRRQEIEEERSVQVILGNAPAQSGSTSIRGGRRRQVSNRGRNNVRRSGRNVIEIEPHEIIVLDDTQAENAEPQAQFPTEPIEVSDDNDSSLEDDDFRMFGEDMFEQIDMLGNLLVLQESDSDEYGDDIPDDDDSEDDEYTELRITFR